MFLYTTLRKIAGLRDSVCKFSLAYMNKVLSPKVKGGGLDLPFNTSIYVWFSSKHVEHSKRYLRHEFGMSVSIIYCLCISQNILIERPIFFPENKDMGRFLYETIKKVNARKTSRIVNLNQIGKNKSAVCMGKSSSCRSFDCQTIEVCSNRLKNVWTRSWNLTPKTIKMNNSCEIMLFFLRIE